MQIETTVNSTYTLVRLKGNFIFPNAPRSRRSSTRPHRQAVHGLLSIFMRSSFWIARLWAS